MLPVLTEFVAEEEAELIPNDGPENSFGAEDEPNKELSVFPDNPYEKDAADDPD